MGARRLWESSSYVKVAKKDAFDSISVLEAARAVAYDANGDESRWLLNKVEKGKPEQIQSYDGSFQEKTRKIASCQGSWNAASLRAEIDRCRTRRPPD